MKKIFVLLALVFLITGCSVKVMPKDDLEKVIDNVLTSNDKLRNQYFEGYTFYMPREVSLVDKYDYNVTLVHKNTKMYLYVDIISYHHKVKKDYELKEDIYFSQLLKHGKKKGIINITEKEDNYYVEIEYNYGKIEAYTNKENLTTIVMNSLYILKTLDFNDVVIDSLIGENKIEYKEEKYNLKVSESEEEYLGVGKIDDDSELEGILEDDDTIELEKEDSELEELEKDNGLYQ